MAAHCNCLDVKLYHVLVSDLDEWHQAEVRFLSPGMAAATLPEGDTRPKGVVLEFVPNSFKPLLKFASRFAFRQLTASQVRDLANDMKWVWPKPRPRSEADIVAFAIMQMQPDLSQEAVTELITKWRHCKPPEWPSSLDASTVDVLDGVLEKDDYKEVVTNASKMQKPKPRTPKEKAGPKAAPAAAAEPGAASSSGSGGVGGGADRLLSRKKKFGFSEDTDIDREAVIPYIPKVKGCCINKDDKRHMRWVGSYPTEVSPFSKSCVWNEYISMRQALLVVLDWVWARHQEAAQEECPFALE